MSSGGRIQSQALKMPAPPSAAPPEAHPTHGQTCKPPKMGPIESQNADRIGETPQERVHKRAIQGLAIIGHTLCAARTLRVAPMAAAETEVDSMPQVAFLISAHSRRSFDSLNLGCYLAACLSLGGQVRVCVVALPSSKDLLTRPTDDVVHDPFPFSLSCREGFWGEKLIPVGKDLLAYEAPIEVLSKVSMIVVCVDGEDTSRSITVIRQHADLKDRTDCLGIVSLQKGVKNSSQLSNSFANDKNVVVLEGAVGFEVAANPVNGSLGPISPVGALVLERISREKAKAGVQMANVLESSGIPIIYRRNLTTFTWGIAIAFGALGAVNALTGGPLKQDLRSKEARYVAAAIIRECRLALKAAARDGKWVPDTEACSRLSLRQLEYLLCLPTPIFSLLAPVLLPIRDSVSSPLQMDLYHRLDASCAGTLSEVETVAIAHNTRTPVLTQVLESIKRVSKKQEGVQVYSAKELFGDVGKPRASAKEALIQLVNLLAALVVVMGLLLLLL